MGPSPSCLPELSRHIYAMPLSSEDRPGLDDDANNDLLDEKELNKLLQEMLRQGGGEMEREW